MGLRIFGSIEGSASIEIRYKKLEKGSTATPWSPAPEDLTHGYSYTLSQPIQPDTWYTLSTDYAGDWQGLWIDDEYVGYFSEGKITFKSPVEISVDSDIVIKVDDVESLITWAKLEKGNKATDWTPAPEDTDAQFLSIEDIKADRVDIANLWTNMTHMETSIELNTGAIELMATQESLDYVTGLVENHEAQLSVLSDRITLDFARLEAELEDATTDLVEMRSYFDFTPEHLNIGKSDSPLNITISNEQMSFLDSGQVVAYVNGQRMYITQAQILESLQVGVHVIEKYNDNITFVRWIGGEA